MPDLVVVMMTMPVIKAILNNCEHDGNDSKFVMTTTLTILKICLIYNVVVNCVRHLIIDLE